MSKTLYHFGVSGGKDSTALLLWAVYESGIPLEQIVATFNEVGNEHPISLWYVNMLSTFVHPIETIRAPVLFYDRAQIEGLFPNPRMRWCTRELKMKPTLVWLNSQPEGVEIILHSGVRGSESSERASMPSEEWDGYFGRKVRRPLLKWTLDDVWAIHDRYGVPRNPLYDMGAERVGCWPCFMLRKREVRLMDKIDPARKDFLKQQEERFPKDGRARPFFYTNRIPENHRTGKAVSKKGKAFTYGTVDDVIRWSKTVRGGKQYALGTIDEDAFEQEDDKTISCPSAIGQCE